MLPKTINNHLAVLKSILSKSVEEGWLTKPAVIKQLKVKKLKRDYSYLRTSEEIERFLNAAKLNRTKVAFYLYACAVYTGMRAGELAGLRWTDICFERRLITVERSYLGPTKSGETRFVPILDALLPILLDWRGQNPLPWVFPNGNGDMLIESNRLFQETLQSVLTAAGFPKITKSKRERHYVTFHDLRHTFASHWMMNGGDIYKLREILGHQSITMTERYSHLSPHVFAEDYAIFPAQNAPKIIPVLFG